MSKRKKSEAALLEKWQTALTNSQAQPQIATQIAKYGYDAAKIAEGQALQDQAKALWQITKQEALETTQAYNAFKTAKKELYTTYSTHRKKAKAKFMQQPEILVQLELTSKLPQAYTSKMQTIQQFYTQLAQNTTLATALQTYSITPEQLEQAQASLTKTQQARIAYLREQGESQDATKQKDKAITNIEVWMQNFYAMATLALEDNPQLLEAIGRFRKS